MYRLRKHLRNLYRRSSGLTTALLAASSLTILVAAQSVAAAPRPQEAQGEIIGTIEGQAIAVKGPMSVQVVGNEVKTLLRSGVDVRVKSGRAKISLTEGGTIAVCGPAHISMLKSGNGLTVALDSGTIHAHVEGNLALNIFTAQILAKSVAIGDGPQDVLVGFDSPGLMCVRAGRGAVHLEEQFGGQSVMVPQGGDVTIANGQIQAMRDNTGRCGCDGFEASAKTSSVMTPEVSTPASSEEVKKSVELKDSAPRLSANERKLQTPKAPAFEPTYQVFMPPLHYDANVKVPDDFDPKLIVLVRRVHVRPTLIFESKVEGDPIAKPASNLTAAAGKQDKPAEKPAGPANATVVDRVKSFFRSLWTPSS